MYGESKKRTMARSVLPSSHRVDARHELRRLARAHRRGTKQALRAFAGTTGDESEDRLEAMLVDRAGRRQRDLWDAVWMRRNGDKISPLMRWAPRATAHLRVEDRMSAMRTWLPDNLIGRHAMSHLSWVDEMAPPAVHDWRYAVRASSPRAEPDREELIELVRQVIAVGRHAELNSRIKAACGVEDATSNDSGAPSRRLLHGLHDVESFSDAVMAVRRGRARGEGRPGIASRTQWDVLMVMAKEVSSDGRPVRGRIR